MNHEPAPSSAIYAGHVRHRRTHPIQNSFRYRFYMFFLNLAESEHLDKSIPLLGYNRRAVTTLYDRDHMGSSSVSIREKLDRWLEKNQTPPTDGPVFMLTQLRVLGYVFNPITLFYCYSADMDLKYVVAEVNNTFGDTLPYLLMPDQSAAPANPEWIRASARKRLHVSPFIAMDASYLFHIKKPDNQRIHFHIQEFQNEQQFFDATLSLHHIPLNNRNLRKVLFRHPMMPLATMALIHWQALKLWKKKAPFTKYSDPPPNGLET